MTPQERTALVKAAKDKYDQECGEERDRFAREYAQTTRNRRAIDKRFKAALDEIAQQYADDMDARADALAHEKEVTTA